MSLTIFAQDLVGMNERATMAAGDDVFVSAGATIGSTDTLAISGAGSNLTVNVQGAVFGADGAIKLGTASSQTGHHLLIGESGYVYTTDGTAVEIDGVDDRVDNHGTISGQSCGLNILGSGPANKSIVVNSGVIEGATGIIKNGDASLEVFNSGEIRGNGYSYRSPINATDIIHNSGLMAGKIYLDSGDDTYDGTGGRVEGIIRGGSGEDTLIGGGYADALDGDEQNDTLSGAGGDDLLDGDTGADTMDGGAGNDRFAVDDAGDKVIDTGGGVDVIFSFVTFNLSNAAQAVGTFEFLILNGITNINGTGNALANGIYGNFGINFIHGMAGNDTLFGIGGDDKLWGDAGNDTLNGGDGTDVLNGGLGNDNLTGGALADKFVFDTKPHNALNRDIITDFEHGLDKIQLSHGVFTGIGGGGGLNPAFFFQGAAAHDANDHIIYNKATGVLSYDNDGTGAHAAIQFAVLSNKPVVTASDFAVI